MPTKVLRGRLQAIGIRLPPLAHPSSRTRQPSTGGVFRPKTRAVVASRSGWVWGKARLMYGTSSYEVGSAATTASGRRGGRVLAGDLEEPLLERLAEPGQIADVDHFFE